MDDLKTWTYHPYLTFAEGGQEFVSHKGKPSISEWSSSTEDEANALWRFGKEVFAALPPLKDKGDFDRSYKVHIEDIAILRKLIKIALEFTFLVPTNSCGDIITVDVDDLFTSDMLNIAWRITKKTSEASEFPKHHFLFACLEEINSAIVGLWAGGGAVSATLRAANAFANFQAIDSGSENLQQARSELALRAAIERHRQDPKQVAKRLVKECWLAWQMKPKLYRTQSVFATDMLTKVLGGDIGSPIISHDTIVKKWIPEWTKSKK